MGSEIFLLNFATVFIFKVVYGILSIFRSFTFLFEQELENYYFIMKQFQIVKSQFHQQKKTRLTKIMFF